MAKRTAQTTVIYWTSAEQMPLDLFSFMREAGRCFSVGCFLGAIALASNLVEIILNRDSRTHSVNFYRIKGWATLNNRNLGIAERNGLPVSILLSAGEKISQERPIAFVVRRNKVAHGDVGGVIRTLSDYCHNAENEALEQIDRAERFLVEWFNTAPDVQQKKILRHNWPA